MLADSFVLTRSSSGQNLIKFKKKLLLWAQWVWYYYYYYLLQLGCHPVAVVILHVQKISNLLLINLSPEGYMRSM